MYKKSIAQILAEASEIASDTDRAQYLINHDSDQMRYLLQLALTPTVQWVIPEGAPPYKPCEYVDIEGRLYQEARTLYLYLEGGNENLTRLKRESLFIGLLESIDPRDADLLIRIKDKKIHPNLSIAVVNLAFPGLINEPLS